MVRVRLASLIAAFCLTGLTQAGIARAEDDAESLIAKGVALRQQGKDAEALTFFQRALEASPSARARAQVGLGEQALGRWVEAESDLAEALKDEGDAWVKRYREPLEQALATVRTRLGWLEVTVNAKDAELSVDGVAAGVAGARPVRLVAGSHVVAVRAAAHHPVSRNVLVPAAGLARESFDLVPLLASSEDAGASGGDGSARGAPREGVSVAPASAQRTIGWFTLAGGGVLLAGGLGAQIGQKLTADKYNASTCPGEAAPVQPPDCQDRIDAAHRWQTLAIVGFAAGGVAAITGAVLVLTTPKTTRTTACTVGPASLACTTTF